MATQSKFAAFAEEIAKVMEVEESDEFAHSADQTTAATHRRWSLEEALVATPPNTLDDVVDVLTMIVKTIESGPDLEPEKVDTAIRQCVAVLAANGHVGRIKPIYFSHVDFGLSR